MIERKKFPPGWACPAGHMDDGEEPEEAAKREVEEETGLKVGKLNFLANEFIPWNQCSRGVLGHDWYVYEALVYSGEIKKAEEEVKNIRWISADELKNISLEKVWEYWFQKFGILK